MNIRHYINFFAYKSFYSTCCHKSIGFNNKKTKILQIGRQGNKEGGFTLIELMGALAIIGILSSVAIPNFIAYRDKAFCSAAESDAKSIAVALADYYAIPSHLSMGELPAVIENNGNLFDGKGPTGLNFSTLSGQNIAQLDGDISNIQIKILDISDRCPEDYIDSNPKWTYSPYPPNPVIIPASFLFGKQYHEQY